MQARKATTAALAAVAIAATTAGCAGADQAAGPPGSRLPDVTATVTVVSASDISLPFDAYSLSNAEDQRSMQAYHGLLAACSRRFGITLTMPIGVNPGVDHTNARRYGIVDPDVAAVHGYGVPPVQETPRWNPAPGELEVLDGVATTDPSPPRETSGKPLPAGGCVAEAEKDLGGAPPYSTERLEGQANEEAEHHPRLIAAFAKWSKCMADKGHPFRSPWEPNDKDWADPPTKEELRTAKDDLACRTATNLAGTWLAVETALQQDIIAGNRARFDALTRWKSERLDRIRALEGSDAVSR